MGLQGCIPYRGSRERPRPHLFWLPKGYLLSLAGSSLPPASEPAVWHLQIFLSVPCSCQHITRLTLTLLPPSLSHKVALTGPQGSDETILRGAITLPPMWEALQYQEPRLC